MHVSKSIFGILLAFSGLLPYLIDPLALGQNFRIYVR